jgi:general secretion pathway protein E
VIIGSGLGLGILAALPQPGSYAGIVKLAIEILLVLPWFWLAIWASQDIAYVRTNGLPWRLAILGTGLLGILLWWLVPFYILGICLYLLAMGAGMGAYVFHRNSLVGPAAKVLTAQHIQGLMKGITGGDRKPIQQIVRFLNDDRKTVPLPANDPDDLERYRLAQELVHDAIWRRASDVDVLTGGGQGKVAYRIDGVMVARPSMTPEDAERVLTFIKRIAGLDLEGHRKPQQGEFTATTSDPVTGKDQAQEIEVRTSGSTTGERLTLRMLTQEKQLRTEDLGMREEQFTLWQEILGKSSGMVIVSGPPTSGVTSTMYAALRHHDAFTQNVQTFEKQVKFDLEVITQHVFDPNKGISFARTLQTILHKDPDILMVGDIPDRETAAQIARGIGHNKKLYIGMAASDCFEALDRWMSLCEDPKAAGQGLLAVTNQRLIRKLCPVCKVAYKPDAELLRRANIPPEKAKQFYRPRTEPRLDKHGNPVICPNCQGSGYFGRVAIFEMLLMNAEIAGLIKRGATKEDIKGACRKRGMLYLQEEALQKVTDGTTSMQEVLRATKSEQPTKKAATR